MLKDLPLIYFYFLFFLVLLIDNIKNKFNTILTANSDSSRNIYYNIIINIF